MTEPEGGILVIELTDEDLGTVEYEPREEHEEYIYADDSMMTPYGKMSPGFDRDNPPWQGGRSDF